MTIIIHHSDLSDLQELLLTDFFYYWLMTHAVTKKEVASLKAAAARAGYKYDQLT